VNNALGNQKHFALAESHSPEEVEVCQHHVWSNFCLVTENKSELLMYSLVSRGPDPAGGEGAGLYPCVCWEVLTKPGFAGRTSHIWLEGKVLKLLLITGSYMSLRVHFGLRGFCYGWQFTALKEYNWLRGSWRAGN